MYDQAASRAQVHVQRSSPAARPAASATASSTLARAAASTANAKPRHGLIAVIRPGTVGESTSGSSSPTALACSV